MRQGLEKRLERLGADLMQAEAAGLARRAMLRARVAVGAELRRLLAERGVDPASVAALRTAEAAAAELAALPDGSAARAAEAVWHAEQADAPAAERFARRLVAIALLSYAEGERPDAARSSLAEWRAWCLVTPGSRHAPSVLADPEVQQYQRMLRLGSGDPRWR